MIQKTGSQNLETRLFKPIDLIPFVGFFTNLHKIFNYNDETKQIRQCGLVSNKDLDKRELKPILIGGAMTLYHVVALGVIEEYYHIGEKIYKLFEKLI